MNEMVDRLFAYSRETYSVEPDYPFSTDPDIPVLRHLDTRKWFALFMEISRSRLGLEGSDRVWVLNIKCDPLLSGSLRMQKGYYPGYHMNHDSWLTILLDGTVPFGEITPLLDMSFELTDKKRKIKRKK